MTTFAAAQWDQQYTDGLYAADGPVASLAIDAAGNVYGGARMDITFGPLMAAMGEVKGIAPSFTYIRTLSYSNSGGLIADPRTDPIYDVAGTRLDPVSTIVSTTGSFLTFGNYTYPILIGSYEKILVQTPSTTTAITDAAADLRAVHAILVSNRGIMVGTRNPGPNFQAIVKAVSLAGGVTASWTGSIASASVEGVRVAPIYVDGVRKILVLANVTPNSGLKYAAVWRLSYPGLVQELGPVSLVDATGGNVTGFDIASTGASTVTDPPVCVVGQASPPGGHFYGPAWYVSYLDKNLNVQWTYMSPSSEVGTAKRVRFRSNTDYRPIVYGNINDAFPPPPGPSHERFRKFTVIGGTQWTSEPYPTTVTQSVEMVGVGSSTFAMSTQGTTTMVLTRINEASNGNSVLTTLTQSIAIPGGAGSCNALAAWNAPAGQMNVFAGGSCTTPTTGAAWTLGRNL